MGPTIAENIVLVGFMGVGKTSLASALARRTGAPLVDTDAEIEKRTGQTISALFATCGEDFFRNAETDLLQECVAQRGRIISTGGGMVVREENRKLLVKAGMIVWLNTSEEVIYDRVKRNSKRPLLKTENARETLRELLASRLPLYRAVADLELDSGEMSRRKMVETVLAAAGWKRI